ncbi:histidine decarboxylase [Kitasatospora phosalacinea]|uniref:histidine decarboxylase n=1 Tax=Kitasatospora phosalacinea TaxID=2065 RepID=UPI003666B7DE
MAIGPAPSADGAQDMRLLLDQAGRMRHRSAHDIGYPVSLDADFRAFGPLLDTLWIAIGDPEDPDPTRNCRQPFEREVVRFLARLAGADPDRTYGYVAAGGSEGNLFGLHLGRERLPDAPLYHSDAAHHSVVRAARLLRMETVRLPSRRDGSLDTDALHRAAARCPGRGAVVAATVGTTMLGGVDDLPAVRAALRPAGEHHLHVDAALGGLVAALGPTTLPWAFEAGADSVTVSGHKLLGIPLPCAVVLARAELLPGSSSGDYLGADDRTLACSRNGLTPVMLWYQLRRHGTDGLRTRIRRCLDVAAHAEHRLAALGRRPWRHPASLTVVFDRPAAKVCLRWHLATSGGRAHLVAMPHVTRTTIDALCRDLA